MRNAWNFLAMGVATVATLPLIVYIWNSKPSVTINPSVITIRIHCGGRDDFDRLLGALQMAASTPKLPIGIAVDGTCQLRPAKTILEPLANSDRIPQ